MSKVRGHGACARTALMLLITGLILGLLFDGLTAMGGAGLVVGSGVFFALAVEDRVAPSRVHSSDQANTARLESTA